MGRDIPRTQSTFAPGAIAAPAPRMRASADVYQRPSRGMEGTLRQRYSLASGPVRLDFELLSAMRPCFPVLLHPGYGIYLCTIFLCINIR